MSYDNFVWSDLSTFNLDECEDFYRQLFGWEFYAAGQYRIAYQNGEAAAAVFVMPEKLQKINMPSFWMSYVRVADLAAAVCKAQQHKGAIVEIPPTKFDEQSRFALVRDPSGAGFTLYEGADLAGRAAGGHGRCVWNVIHVGDVRRIVDFYRDLFGWQFQPAAAKVWDIVHASGEVIAQAEEHDELTRGGKQYWMPIFAVRDMPAARRTIGKLGGVYIHNISDALMFADQQGGHFLLREEGGGG